MEMLWELINVQVLVILVMGSFIFLCAWIFNVLDYYAYLMAVLMFVLSLASMMIRSYGVGLILLVISISMVLVMYMYQKKRDH